MIIRFVMGLIALVIACPKPIRGTTLRQELTFAGAGLSGITLYYLLENIALTHTTASNVSVIASVAPFFTGSSLLCGVPRQRKATGDVLRGIRHCHDRHLHAQLFHDEIPGRTSRRSACSHRCCRMGILLHPDTQNQRLRFQHNSGDAKDLRIRHFIHDTGMVSYGLSSGAFPVRRSCKSEQHAVSGSGSIGRLLRDVEFRHQTSGCSGIQRLYLCHPADHGHRSCYRAPRAGDGFQVLRGSC